MCPNKKAKPKFTPEFIVRALQQHIEDVEIAFLGIPSRHPGFFEQVPVNVGAQYPSGGREMDFDIATLDNPPISLRDPRQKKTDRREVLTNREELSFRTVLAFPNASRIGLASKIRASSCSAPRELCEEREVSHWTTLLVFSVFPAPDSPLSPRMISTTRADRNK
jgi:hypothetical protein